MKDIDTGTDQLLCQVRDRVSVITLNRPDSRNALSDDLSPALRRMIKHAADDDEIGAVLVTGAGTAFCAGGDVKGMGSGTNSRKAQMTTEERIADLQVRQRTMTGALFELRKPTVAALPGPAAGAGLAIALACDIRIAAESAFVSTGYARVGLSGDYGISWLLTNVVGTARARELMYTADRVGSERAERIGLFNRVVPDAELQTEAFGLAASLAAGPAVALRNMKDNLNDALTQDFLTSLDGEAPRLVEAARTSDHREAVSAFKEKRAPRFTGN